MTNHRQRTHITLKQMIESFKPRWKQTKQPQRTSLLKMRQKSGVMTCSVTLGTKLHLKRKSSRSLETLPLSARLLNQDL
jgi:hypothetical protein